MPLMQGKSSKAFDHNLKAEMNAGKPQKQSLAIAYSIKRKNQKMASGGMVHCAHGGAMMCSEGCYAKGGEVMNEKLHPMEQPSGIAKSILKRKMAAGGEVENEDHLMEDDYDEDFLSREDDDDAAINLTYPDPDNVEGSEGMDEEEDPKMKRRKLLSNIFSEMSSK